MTYPILVKIYPISKRLFLISVMKTEIHITPAWLTIPGAVRYSGIGRASIEAFVKKKLVDSRKVVQPGNKSGRRLIRRSSLDQFIENGGAAD